MILQALVQYYDRKRGEPDSDIAPLGWVRRPIDYVFELTDEGRCTSAQTLFTVERGKRVGHPALLPAIGKQALKHTNSGKDANLLWDNASFALGWKDPRSIKLESFAHAVRTFFPSTADPGISAVNKFLATLQADSNAVAKLVRRFGLDEDFASRDPVIAFQLLGDSSGPIHHRPIVASTLARGVTLPGDTPQLGQCLLTGEVDVPLADNETVIKNVWNSQPAGANLVSFNSASFSSYGKFGRGAGNAPIGRIASFAYTTALNHLLETGSRNRVQVGDASTVFWADRASRFDSEFTLADFFGENKDNPDRGRQAVQALLSAVQTGRLPVGEEEVHFYVLGLAPNAARISVRFWLHAPFAELAPRILQHFADLRVAPRYESDPPAPSLFRLLSGLALQGKLDNVPPRLAGEWMRAILENLPYPATLLNAAVTRCKAERDVSYLRAAVLKAWLNREHRRKHPELSTHTQHFKEALDMDQTDTPYRLGRLFAVLERIQAKAMPGINTTIRDRYYSAASTTPVAVFTTLLRLKNAHLKKLSDGETGFFERLIGEVLEPLGDFPRQLTLPQQARFALGYYHQRQHFFTRKTDDNNPTAQEN